MTLRSRRKRPTTLRTTANKLQAVWELACQRLAGATTLAGVTTLALASAVLAAPLAAAEPAAKGAKPAVKAAPAPTGWRSAKKTGVAPAIFETERTGYDENIQLVAGAEMAPRASQRPSTKSQRPAPRVAAQPGQIQDVDPLDDPFVDPFAQAAPGSPAANAPAPKRPAASPTRQGNSSRVIRSQPLQLPNGDEDEIQLEPMPTEPVSQPREVQRPPALRSTPQNSDEDADYPCPDPASFKQLDQISLRLEVDGLTPKECTLDDQTWIDRCFCELTYTWKASALCSKPLYFEEEQLERYGRMRYPMLQPVISGAKFYGNIVMWPYKMGVNNPRECVYALGYYRPGSCAPRFRKTLRPISIEGVLYEAAVLGGIVALVP